MDLLALFAPHLSIFPLPVDRGSEMHPDACPSMPFPHQTQHQVWEAPSSPWVAEQQSTDRGGSTTWNKPAPLKVRVKWCSESIICGASSESAVLLSHLSSINHSAWSEEVKPNVPPAAPCSCHVPPPPNSWGLSKLQDKAPPLLGYPAVLPAQWGSKIDVKTK